MRKCLLLAALLVVSQLHNIAIAQGLFSAPDTVCIRQPVQLTSNVPGASSHYWGFCSGYLLNSPVGLNQGSGFGFNAPSAIEITKDGDNYYALVANSGSTELMRLNYGTSLDNVPTVTNFGNLNNALPVLISSIYIVKDEANNTWHAFLSGGNAVGNSQLARLDFGSSLGNDPNIVNFGNLGNVLDYPVGLFVAKEGANWLGFAINRNTNSLVRLDIGNNISLTPSFTVLGNPNFTLNGASDMSAILDGGNWFFFVTNENAANGKLARIDMGTSLTNNNPSGFPIIDLDGQLFSPSGISIIRDCGELYAFITSRLSSELVRMSMPSIFGPYTGFNYGNVAAANMAFPAGLTRLIRDRDDIYTYVINNQDNTLSQIKFAQCTNSSIASSTSSTPPEFSYNTPGRYNLYYVVDEGLPTMQVECKEIDALPIPSINLSNDTVLCQGDTARLVAFSVNADSTRWRPNYNISDTDDVDVFVYPEYSVQYRITLTFPNGCIVDTGINIEVRKIKADAGADRTLSDGAKTVLGGPNTTLGSQYAYTWTPNQYINATNTPNPVASPPSDFTYYLEVQDVNGCRDIDTVLVFVRCNDINLPNAFAPESANGGGSARFGLKNRQIVKLNYFRIFDRWGKLVFETTDPTKQWDGTVNGEPAALGVYVWEADGFCTLGQRFQKSGNVTLLR